jgi:hypothetical protein
MEPCHELLSSPVLRAEEEDRQTHINFNTYDLGLSGGSRFIFELSNRLVERGHEVTITHLGREEQYTWFKPVLAKVINVGGLSLAERAFRKYLSKYDFDFEKAMVRAVPDCDVNVATYCFTAYPTLYSRKGRMFYLVQNYEPWFFDDKWLSTKAEITYSLPMTKLCVSNWLTQKIGGLSIGNGINLKRFKRLKEKKAREKEWKIMAFLRGISWKQDDLVLEALSKLDAPCRLLVPRRASDEALVDMYNEADILVFGSKFEGFGYPPLEAMACGTPVVTTNCAGVSEYAVHAVNAYVALDDREHVAKAISTLLCNPSLYNRLVEGGLETARKFDFEKVVDRFESCIS